MILPSELLQKGGAWLGAVRNWMQWNKHNGSDVIWGSSDVLNPPMTVRQCEELAAEAVCADRNDKKPDTELQTLRAFYKAVAKLTVNHNCIDDSAVVFPCDLDKELNKVNPNWYMENFNFTKKD